MSKELAIIHNPHFGNRDTGKPCLWFSVNMVNGCGALQVLWGKEALQFIEESKVYDIKSLDGKGIAVNTEGLGGLTKIVQPFEFY